jgi:RNA polymerase sigma-70 factor, ECF subfamily
MFPAMDRLTGLLVQARDGDRLALGAAIRLSQAEVWRVAAHLVGPNEADDVTQDVFLRA